ncbi:MAG: mycofactocin system transcriptional regulator [Frankiales bacterium]|nr:mycofactocin system transcriptional regulator [Frankiales bacterium]
MVVTAGPGRPRATSRDDLERVAFELFRRQGFDTTTVDDIAAAAGIGRRTFFRYFASKNDVVWGRFDEGLAELRRSLAAVPESTPIGAALRSAIVGFNALPAEQVAVHRQRMRLIFEVASLQAHSTLMYAAWRDAVASFVARRLGQSPDDFTPRLAGHVLLGAAVAAYEQWLADPAADLADLLNKGVGRAVRIIDASR